MDSKSRGVQGQLSRAVTVQMQWQYKGGQRHDAGLQHMDSGGEGEHRLGQPVRAVIAEGAVGAQQIRDGGGRDIQPRQ